MALEHHWEHALEITRQGAQELLPLPEWVEKLKSARPLRIKLGLDPTAADIHLGHTVVLQKLRQLQKMGHTVIFLIGDFTSMIGDPSGRNMTRPALTQEEIQANAKTYCDQVSKILDIEKTEVRYNSEWCEALGSAGLLQLCMKHTVARMLERDDFSRRFSNQVPIGIHEFLYPLLQGYDSVALKSDLELGGTDQKFNLLMGRQLQIDYGQPPQCILTMPLLEGLDGIEKMSKSKGNTIGVTEEPNTMFAKVMSINDELMWRWYPLLSDLSIAEIEKLRQAVEQGSNPKVAKVNLAKIITARFHSAQAADAAELDFDRRASGGIPDHVPEVLLSVDADTKAMAITHALKEAGLCASNGEAARLIAGQGVRINSDVVSDKGLLLKPGSYVLQVGKRKFARVVLN